MLASIYLSEKWAQVDFKLLSSMKCIYKLCIFRRCLTLNNLRVLICHKSYSKQTLITLNNHKLYKEICIPFVNSENIY